MRTALSWVVTQRVVVIPYRHFRTTYWSHLQGSRTRCVVTQKSTVLILWSICELTDSLFFRHVSPLTNGWLSWWENYLYIYSVVWWVEMWLWEGLHLCTDICSGTVGCGLQRRWTAGYIGNGGMTKYALSEDMEQIDWVWIFFFFVYTILLAWKLWNIFVFSFHPFPPTPSNYS